MIMGKLDESTDIIEEVQKYQHPETYKNGETIDPVTLEIYLGNEVGSLLLQTLQEDEFVDVIGGTATRILLGHFLNLDELTSDQARSDIDIVYPQNNLALADKINADELSDGRIARKLNLGDRKLEIVSAAVLKGQYLQAAQDIMTWGEINANNQVAGYAREFIQRFNETNTDETNLLLTSTAMFQHETLRVRLTKRNGVIIGTCMDPTGYLEDPALNGETENPILITQTLSPEASIMPVMLHILATADKFETSSMAPWWVLETYRRKAIFTSEQKQNQNPFDSAIQDMYKLGERLSRREVFLQLTGDAAKMLARYEATNANELFERFLKEGFARTAAADPTEAFELMFIESPLGKLLGDAFNELIDNHYSALTEKRKILYSGDIGSSADKLDEIDTRLTNSPLRKARAQLSNIFLDRYPANMSDYWAAIFIAMGWDGEESSEIRKGIVENWKVAGVLTDTWIGTSVGFEKGIKSDLVDRHIEMIKEDENRKHVEWVVSLINNE
jgi:hypothetical protein